MKERYPLPFDTAHNAEEEFRVLKNALEFELIGSKPVDLDFNIDHHAFKLKIQFYFNSSQT